MNTVKGSELAKLAGNRDTVVKIGGRWYWVVEVDDPATYGTSCSFATVVAQAKDPRLAGRQGYRKIRVIYPDETYLTRARKAPVWEWVTRSIERETA
jgi:hypothetical protein